MKIAIVGTGYVGLVTGTCFAEMGINVVCIDIDEDKINLLKKGIVPIYEPGLEYLVTRNAEMGRLHFSVDIGSAISGCEVVFIAVGTPPDEDGSADLSYVLDVASTIGRHMSEYLLVVNKSTVPVGTALKVKKAIQNELLKRDTAIPFDVASNPEFLKEGSAVEDFLKPDRIVIGVESDRAEALLKKLYKPFTLNGHPIIIMDVPSAEMTKYAANAMLATRISFINDIANLCEKVGADVNSVRKGIGSDSRIGHKFLYPGVGYGGSCFPKDVKALIKTASEYDYPMKVLQAVEEVNHYQKTLLFEKVRNHFGGQLAGKIIALWGLAFKPETDDMRESPSVALINLFLDAGCKIKAYDPVAMNEGRRLLKSAVHFSNDPYEAVSDADCLLLVTEWKAFRVPDLEMMKKLMKSPLIFDGRNIFDPVEIRTAGFVYYGIGVQ